MKPYVSHKKVVAGRIEAIETFGDATLPPNYRFTLEDGTTHEFDSTIAAQYTPVVGDYLVVYEDGYRSISPAESFLDGYTEYVATAETGPIYLEQFDMVIPSFEQVSHVRLVSDDSTDKYRLALRMSGFDEFVSLDLYTRAEARHHLRNLHARMKAVHHSEVVTAI